MGNFVVIDTETTWSDEVMSIGLVIASCATFDTIDSRYYIIDPEYRHGGMFSSVLHYRGTPQEIICSRNEAMTSINQWLKENHIDIILAYNARFDKGHLPELKQYTWCDIMRLAAYIQFNCRIPCDAPLYKTGRLKRGYGVESIVRLLSNNPKYYEKHNAWWDANDELMIMRLLEHPIALYLEHTLIED